ncbi:MAG: inositol monophosphatase [Desulfobacterales bacterium]|nr:inositol monophosphatase [Desulfobacterales bacterium]
MDIEAIQRTAIKAAFRSGKVLKSHFGALSEIRKKGNIDLVTKADIESEDIIVRTIRERFPEHYILAEERGLEMSSLSSCKWIIDPLDGTTNFAHNLPMHAVSIAFTMNDEVMVGVILNPQTGELFSAIKGKGAFLNNSPIHVSKSEYISESLLVTGFPYDFKDNINPILKRFETCLKASRGVRRLGSAALDLCFVACGRFDCFWEQNLKTWDTAAGFLIVCEAGGTITDFSNGSYNPEKNEILATNGLIHKEMIELLKL